jgi:hypothetical protein
MRISRKQCRPEALQAARAGPGRPGPARAVLAVTRKAVKHSARICSLQSLDGITMLALMRLYLFSRTDGCTRFMGHSAFEDPLTPPDAPQRTASQKYRSAYDGLLLKVASGGARLQPQGDRTRTTSIATVMPQTSLIRDSERRRVCASHGCRFFERPTYKGESYGTG